MVTNWVVNWPTWCPACYLSLIGKAVGADDAFVKLHGSFGISGFVFVPEVHVVQAKPLRVAFIPFKLIQQRPGGVAPHVHSVFDS